MLPIKTSATVTLTISEINHINDLIAKETAKAVEVYKVGDTELTKCPACENLVFGSEKYCKECGQKLDHDNKAL